MTGDNNNETISHSNSRWSENDNNGLNLTGIKVIFVKMLLVIITKRK